MLATDLHDVTSDWIARTRPLIDTHLDKLLASPHPSPVLEAMRYSVLSGGKRVRPLLTLAVAEYFGRAPADALQVACAIEMVHSASLILDDLPCMDNDRERRNRLSTHVVYGEDLTILAAISLLTQSYCVLASHETLTPDMRTRLIQLMCDTIGPNGLSLGQYIDLTSKSDIASAAAITDMHHLKTGVLFLAAARAGCLLCDASPEQEEKVMRFTRNLGMAFQLMDDLADAGEARPNLAARMGIVSAERRLRDYLQAADSAIGSAPDAMVLRQFAASVLGKR